MILNDDDDPGWIVLSNILRRDNRGTGIKAKSKDLRILTCKYRFPNLLVDRSLEIMG